MEASKRNVQAICYALIGFVFFNGADAFLKQITSQYETSFTGLVVIGFELLIFLAISPWVGGLKPIYQTKKLKLNILRGAFAASCWLFFILGLKYVSLSVNYSILLSSSFWVAVFCALFYKQNFGLYRWLAIVAGFIGVLVVMRPGTESFQIASILPLLAALCFAGSSLTARAIGENESNSPLIFYIIAANIIIMGIFTMIEKSWQPIPMEHIPYFFIPAIFYIIGIILTNIAFTKGDTAAVNPMQYSQIIWAVLIGYFFFAETPENWTLIGAAIIVVSGIYLIHREHKNEKST